MAAFRQDEVFGSRGWSGGQWWVGTTIFTATLATILWKAALITEYVHKILRELSYIYYHIYI
jgi:phospholipid-transporting ATPase